MTSMSNADTFKFIELYRHEEMIWNPNHIDHKDKSMLKDAWCRIAEAMSLPVADLKKRKESLMSTFRMRYKQKQLAIRTGRDHEFSTSWVFFDALEAFLKDVYELKKVNAKTMNFCDSNDQTEYSDEDDDGEEKGCFDLNQTVKIESSKHKRKAQSPLNFDESSHGNTVHAEFLNIDTIDKTSKTIDTEDICDLYGRILAQKLRRFSEIERDELMYEIDGLVLKKNHNRNKLDLSQAPGKTSKIEEFDSSVS